MYRNNHITQNPGIRLFCILAAGILLLTASAAAQVTTISFPNGNYIADMEIQGNYVWCATHGSLVRWNKTDGTYRQFTSNDGLMGNNVYDVVISPDEALWIVDSGYVQRYDGSRFTTYSMKDAGLDNASAGKIAFESTGVLWVTTEKGVASFDGKTWKTFTPANSPLPAVNILEIVIDKNNVKWFSFPNTSDENGKNVYNGVFSFDGTTWKQYNKTNSELTFNPVTSMAVGADNVKWFGSTTNIFSFDGTTWEKYSFYFANDLSVDANGVLWVAAGDTGGGRPIYSLSSYDGNSWTQYPLDTRLDRPIWGYYNVRVDADGTIWFVTCESTVASSLHKYDGATVKTYHTDGPLDYCFSGIAIDNMDRKWFSTHYGVTCFDGKSWVNHLFTLTKDDVDENTNLENANMYANWFRAIAVDHDGAVWAAAYGGDCIMRFDGIEWKIFSNRVDETFLPISPEAILVDKNNAKWFVGNGVTCYDGKAWSTYKRFELRLGSGAVDKDNVKWFGSISNDGVWSFDGTTWNHYNKDNSPVTGYDIKVAVDKNNVKWFAATESYTNSKWTMYRFDGTTWKTYGPELIGVPEHSSIDGLYVDSNNVLWISHSSLTSFDGKTWKTWPDIKTGWSSTLAFDNKGYMWLASLYGVGDVGMLSALKFSPEQTLVEDATALPTALEMRGNYPNPFNPSTIINFTLPSSGVTNLSIYNITGQKVRDLVSGPLSAGVHSVAWDGRDDSGKQVSSGVYISRLSMGDKTAAGRMLLEK